MAQAFYEASPAAKRVLDEAEAAHPGLLKLMWEGPKEDLTLTANQQPALVAAGAAAYAAYIEAGGKPASFGAGHSLGEYSAHVAAGSLGVGAAVKLVHLRGSYMQEAVPEGEGAMAAVLKLDDAQIAAVLADVNKAASPGELVQVANLNAPGQTVISGSQAAVARASELFKGLGGRAIPLAVSAPFHCDLMAPAAARLAGDLAAAAFGNPAFTIVCNVTAEPLTDVSQAPRLLTEQVTSSVRWVESVRRLAFLGAERFIEFGSGEVLAGLVRRILPDVETISVQDPASLAEALA
ncbi:MAG: ACP S-malonyltransferase [Trueperaceae bacterium]|nr:ACP S-malonyltransferase [Trueperaceae bacterium]